MSKILPAGQHYGAILQSWSSDQMSLCRVVYDRDMVTSVHGNEQASMVFVEAGHCTKQMGVLSVDLPVSSGIFIPSEHLQRDSFPRLTTFLAAEFSAAFLDRLRDLGLDMSRPISFPAQETQQLRTRMGRELMNPDSLSKLVLEGLLLSTIALAHRETQQGKTNPPSWLKKARDLLHDSLAEPLAMEDIAHLVGIHPAHLSREFRRWFHCTPGEYMREQRVQLAKRRLAETDVTLAQIAYETGFSDQAHFSRVFRMIAGSTPSTYRRSIKAS